MESSSQSEMTNRGLGEPSKPCFTDSDKSLRLSKKRPSSSCDYGDSDSSRNKKYVREKDVAHPTERIILTDHEHEDTRELDANVATIQATAEDIVSFVNRVTMLDISVPSTIDSKSSDHEKMDVSALLEHEQVLSAEASPSTDGQQLYNISMDKLNASMTTDGSLRRSVLIYNMVRSIQEQHDIDNIAVFEEDGVYEENYSEVEQLNHEHDPTGSAGSNMPSVDSAASSEALTASSFISLEPPTLVALPNHNWSRSTYPLSDDVLMTPPNSPASTTTNSPSSNAHTLTGSSADNAIDELHEEDITAYCNSSNSVGSKALSAVSASSITQFREQLLRSLQVMGGGDSHDHSGDQNFDLNDDTKDSSSLASPGRAKSPEHSSDDMIVNGDNGHLPNFCGFLASENLPRSSHTNNLSDSWQTVCHY